MVDPELPIIFSFVFACAVLVLVMAQIFHRRTVKHEERKLELKLEIERAKAAQGNVRIEDHSHLEDRLRVLERIVTDPTADLSRQIDDLRQLQPDQEKVR